MSEPPATNLPPVESVAPTKKRRWWLWGCLIIPLIVFAVVAAAYLILDWKVERHLEEVKANLSFKLVPAKELPTLWGPAPKPEDNAAPIYAEIYKKLVAMFETPEGTDYKSSEQAKRSDELDKLMVIWGLERPDCWPVEPAEEENQKPKIPPRDTAQAHKFLDQFAEVFKLRDEAAPRPGYRRDVDWSNFIIAALPNLSGNMKLANLTILRSAVAAEEGRWDDAYAEMEDIAIMTRHLEQEKSVIQCLIVVTLRINMARPLADMIQRHPPSAKQDEDLRRLLSYDAKSQLRDCLIAECVGGNGCIDQILSGKMSPSAIIDRPVPNLGQLYFNDDRGFFLEEMDHFISAAVMPLDQAREANLNFANSCNNSPRWRHILSRVLMPCLVNLYKSPYQCQTTEDLLLVALDLAAYRQEHGKYPAALAELPNAAKLPRDPFTETGAGGPENEKPFHYRLVGEGFVLWSVGPEGKDGAETTVEQLEDESGTTRHVFLRVPPKAWETEPAKQ